MHYFHHVKIGHFFRGIPNYNYTRGKINFIRVPRPAQNGNGEVGFKNLIFY